MLDYSTNGAMYKLELTIKNDEGDVYYGSTTQALYISFHGHKTRFLKNSKDKCKSSVLFQKYGIENMKIVLIKYFCCDTKKELEAEESVHIRNNKFINTVIPNRTRKEYKTMIKRTT